jgi:energy-coupling factor transporter ATPase
LSISIRDLWWKYGEEKEATWILEGIDLDVKEGEFVVITGPNESGKTTLCLCLNGLIPYNFEGVFKGNVTVVGMNTRSHRTSDLAPKVGMVFQDPDSQFITLSVDTEVAFGPENFGLPIKEIQERVDWALKAVRMEDYKYKAPRALSGGQKQRVAIAAALALRPDILVLDEPTSNLDPVGKAEVLEIISELRKEIKLTAIIVEHNVEDCVAFADRFILLHNGKIELSGSPEEFFEHEKELKESWVRIPQVTELSHLIEKNGTLHLSSICLTLNQAHENLDKILRRQTFVRKKKDG